MPNRLIVRGDVVTMNQNRDIIGNGAVLIEGARIAVVGRFTELAATYPTVDVSGTWTDLVLPGYVNGHQHLTGDRLIQSSIPDNLAPGESIFTWAVPIHAEHSGDDDELAATLTLAESLTNGITTTFEAGTVAHPDRVVAAALLLGARLTIGTWGWDVDVGPYAGPVDEVIERQRRTLDLATANPNAESLNSAWVSLVGHDLMSDELLLAAAELAADQTAGLTFHMSPNTNDADSYLARTGKRPLVHLNDLGVLGPNVAVAHAVHIDEAEITALIETNTSVVSCPWAYLRLGQGISDRFAHGELWRRGGRLSLGCDAENAGDMVDGIRTAALFAGLAKDTNQDPTEFGAHDALELLTIKGAEALNMADRIGSIEVGKQADLVVHDRSHIEWIPPSPDPVLQLIWGTDGRSVRDVFVAGTQVVRDGAVTALDVPALLDDAVAAGHALRTRSGVPAAARWPVSE
ncbi:amidohydrolase family protein [Acidimicrobiaceae bacterium AH-315-P05]|nr:amidohydrolase family protein [Acidimicrobiaceae bacterium AH-315-P05]